MYWIKKSLFVRIRIIQRRGTYIEILGLLIDKLFIMFLFMLIGVILFRKKIITEAGSESLANLLIHLILPCVIINGFLTERTSEKLYGFLVSLFASVLILSISILVARKCFFKNPIGHFAAAFSNPGFFRNPSYRKCSRNRQCFLCCPIYCLSKYITMDLWCRCFKK